MIETAFMAFGICDDAGRCFKADAVFLIHGNYIKF